LHGTSLLCRVIDAWSSVGLGYTWLYMVIHGYTWLYMVIHGYTCLEFAFSVADRLYGASLLFIGRSYFAIYRQEFPSASLLFIDRSSPLLLGLYRGAGVEASMHVIQ
jgi:hypothetical protein